MNQRAKRPSMLRAVPKWLTSLRDSDPGRIRLKQGVRTTLSAFVTACILYLLGQQWPLFSGMLPIMMGAMSATIASQILNGETRRQQQAATLTAGASGILMVLITFLIRNATFLNGITMSVLAFAVFYIRRFGLLYVGLGLYTLFIFMFGTVVAKTEASPLPAGMAILLSIPVTFIINFYFLPANRRFLFRDSVFLFMEQADRVVTLLHRVFSGRISAAEAEMKTHQALKDLQKRLTGGEDTLAGISTEDEDEQNLLESLYVNEYRTYGAMSLAIDAVMETVAAGDAAAGPQGEQMEKVFRLLATLLKTAKQSRRAGQSWQQQLDRYSRLVNTARNDLLAGHEITKGRAFFLARLLLILDRVGEALGALHDDLIRFEAKVGP